MNSSTRYPPGSQKSLSKSEHVSLVKRGRRLCLYHILIVNGNSDRSMINAGMTLEPVRVKCEALRHNITESLGILPGCIQPRDLRSWHPCLAHKS
jgi:hypothetical protein